MDSDVELPATNPLLDGLSPFIPYSRMPAALLCEPLDRIPWRTVAPADREPFLEKFKDHFFPTTFGINLATRVECAIRDGLERRDPRTPSEQWRINQLYMLSKDNVEILPSLTNPAVGGILDGWTGSGKSSLLKRTLCTIASRQVLKHPRSEACGWSTLTQIPYLYVDFPSNGTRGALVIRVLSAIDVLIGTNYVTECLRLRNLDAALLFVMKVLSVHRVGMLVLDEAQPETFDQSTWFRELATFFLALLNLGIPTFLCGHPRAFEALERKAQLSRRFADIGHFRLRRAASDSNAWWFKELAFGIMRFRLCERVANESEIVATSRVRSGGVPGIFVRLWVEAQRIALRRCRVTAELTIADLDEAARVPEISDLLKMATWLEADKPDDLAYDDLERYGPGDTGATTADAGDPVDEATPLSASPVDAATELRKRLQQDKKKADAAKKRDEQLRKSARPGDLRVERIINVLAGLDANAR